MFMKCLIIYTSLQCSQAYNHLDLNNEYYLSERDLAKTTIIHDDLEVFETLQDCLKYTATHCVTRATNFNQEPLQAQLVR